MKQTHFLIAAVGLFILSLAPVQAQSRLPGYQPETPPSTPPATQQVPEKQSSDYLSKFGFQKQRSENKQTDNEPRVVPNQDIMVTKDIGEWMICISSYSGPEAHAWARQLVAELRGPNYKLPAYVFTKGQEEKRREDERIRKIIESRKKLEAYANSTGGNVYQGPLRVKKYNSLSEQVAIVIGGYETMEAARKAMDDIRKLPAPIPRKSRWTACILQ